MKYHIRLKIWFLLGILFAEHEDLEFVNKLRKQVNDIHVSGKPEIFKECFPEELRNYIYSIFDNPLKRIVVYGLSQFMVGKPL